MMQSGLWTGFFLNEERIADLPSMLADIRRLRAAGFSCGEMDERNAFALFVACTEEVAKKNAATLAEEHFFTQLHAPKPVNDLLLQNCCEDRILTTCAAMCIPVIVTHPYIADSPEMEPKKESLSYLCRFTEKAERFGLKIALENQIYPVDLDFYLDNNPGMGVNIDFAHALATGADVPAMIRQYGARLFGLHVSDSDGRTEDYHIMPGKGILSWQEVLASLAEVNYTGDLHLEIVHERSTEKEKNDRTAAEAFSTCEKLLRQAKER